MSNRLIIAVRFIVGAIALMLAATAPAVGANSDTVLTVVSGGNARDFTREELKKFPKWTFATTTPWTEGPTVFEGVRLSDLLDAVDGGGINLKATALNEYAAIMKIGDVRDDALVAYAMNGKAMSVRDKGPLWMVFPFDAKPHLKAEQYYSRSVWQLRSLSVDN